MLTAGNKVLISHRRLFQNDDPRYFLGEVIEYDAGIVKLGGFSFVWDMTGGRYIKKPQPRVKLVSLSAGTVFAYQLPDETEVGTAEFVTQVGSTKLVDNSGLEIDMAEWPSQGEI